MVLIIILQKVVIPLRILKLTVQMKATEQYVPAVLFIVLYKMVLTFASVDEILVWPFK